VSASRLVVFLLLASCSAPSVGAPGAAENVILVTIDGFRWQEVFEGAEEPLLAKQNGGAKDEKGLRRDFWRDTPEARRAALLPFTWGVMAKEGQILGNGRKDCAMRVTNEHRFSYPGYAEMLCGFADARVDSNKKVPNPNVTVLEWLNRRPGFEGRVAAYCTWDVFPSILNRERSGFLIHQGPPVTGESAGGRSELLEDLYADLPPLFGGVCVDALEFHAGMDYLKVKKPRVFYLALGETDEWAHEGRYDQYLHAARRCDGFVKRLWETVQSMPEYRGKTSILVTADHGRGDAPVEWKNHGAKVKGAEFIWVAMMGPRIPALGERSGVEGLTQARIAATIAALVGEDYRAAIPQAAPALPLK
jgi:hypothetical protein